jgi:putative uncharacterized protein (fragment)
LYRYPKRTKPVCVDSKIDAGEKKKNVSLFASFIFMIGGLLLPLQRKPTTKRISSFFVTILLPTVSNRWASLLIIRLIHSMIYNLWQNLINSWQLWKKRKREEEEAQH